MSKKADPFHASLIQQTPWPIPQHYYVIAEIGINHNGSIEIAKRLIEQAKAAGCDAVKFQKRTIDVVYSKDTLDQPRESPWGKTQREQKEGLEFGLEEYSQIDAHCRQLDIDWLASAWDTASQEFLRKFNCRFNKIASAMTTNIPFVEAVASEGKPVLLSTGMCSFEDVDRALAVLRAAGCDVILLHTVSTYPCAEEHLNLQVINTLREHYGLPVGYSGHEASVSPSIMAAMMGAVVIERHVTLDRAMYGSDQAASLELSGLLSMVGTIRKIPLCLGSAEKTFGPPEQSVAKKLRYW
jgi:N-acetylneuraminate synthase